MLFKNIIAAVMIGVVGSSMLCGCDNTYIQDVSCGTADKLQAELQEALDKSDEDLRHAMSLSGERAIDAIDRGVTRVGNMTNSEFMSKLRESARRNNSYRKW